MKASRDVWPQAFSITAPLLTLAAVLLLAACSKEPIASPTAAVSEPPVSLPAPEAIKPAISFNVLMVKFVDQAADPIWTAEVTPPKTNAEWEQIEYHATQLATTGTLLRVGGTGPKDMEWKNSPGWATFADRMTEGALAAALAARNKDRAAVQAAGDQIVLNCEGCHRAFKPDLPTAGLATHLSRGIITAKPKAEQTK